MSEIAVLCFVTGCAIAMEETCQEYEHVNNDGVCEKDSVEQCGSADNDCTRMKGWKSGVCAEAQCVAKECKEGYETKNGKCTATQPDLGCADNEHIYNKQCEKDTLDHCGSHDNNCSEIEGWGSGICKRGECVVTRCADRLVLKNGKCIEDSTSNDDPTLKCGVGEHEYNSECEKDSPEHCGTHDNNCTLIEGWKNGICQNSACFITECQEGYAISNGACSSTSVTTPDLVCGDGTHIFEENCEEDTTENCGTHGINCANIDGWQSGSCTNAKCVASSCKENYTLNDGTCNAVIPLECNENQHVYDGTCENDSVENCGVHGTSCTYMTGWLTGKCDQKMCIPTQCNSGFCIDQTTHICVGGSNTSACGINGGACVACSPGQKCTNGQCVTPLPECSSTQHIHEEGCEDDSEFNCGGHGIKCDIANASGNKCENKKCVITGCKEGFYSHDNACLANTNDNCGEYGKKCGSDSANHITSSACYAPTGTCYATGCDSSSHLYNYTCEIDNNENCGKHGNTCKTEDFPNSTKVMCQSKSCAILKCSAGLEISGNKCVGQNGCPVYNPYYCDGACCQKATCSGSCLLAE